MQNQVWMDVIKCCMIIGWTYLASSSFILFASNLKWLVTKILEGIFSQFISLCSLHKGIVAKDENLCYLSKVLVLVQKLVLGKPLNCALSWWSGFPSNTNLCVHISRFMPMRFAIFMIKYASTITLSKSL